MSIYFMLEYVAFLKKNILGQNIEKNTWLKQIGS